MHKLNRGIKRVKTGISAVCMGAKKTNWNGRIQNTHTLVRKVGQVVKIWTNWPNPLMLRACATTLNFSGVNYKQKNCGLLRCEV